jgi:hypothetical protein
MRTKFDLQRFRAVRLSPELQQEFGLPEFICADPDGLPFPEGQAFRAWLLDENACQPVTALTYLKCVLQFLSFLWYRSPSLRYTAPAEQARHGLREYLRERLGCVVRPHRSGNFVVMAPKAVTLESVRLALSAIKRFYTCAIVKGWYRDPHPLLWTPRLAQSSQPNTPHVPPESGMSLPDPRPGRLPETYFCVVAGQWQPHILDDPNLPKQLVAAFTYHRDQVVARILFESGARVSEVLNLTLGDWRRPGLRDRAQATNKGSRGERVKEIWWSSATTRLLQRYVNEDRRVCAPQRRRLEELPDGVQLFLTDEGKPYTYPAFYYHWRCACARVGLKAHPHQARHWFVTMALHLFQTLPDAGQREAARRSLIAYLGWKDPDTLKAYDHHLRQMDFAATHRALAQLVQSGADARVAIHPTADQAPVSGTEISPALWNRLRGALEAEEAT